MHVTAENVHIHLPEGSAGLLSLPLRGEATDRAAARWTRAAPATTITPPAIGEIWAGEGGHYVGILPAIGDRPAQYMIASTQEAERLKWGPYSDIEGARSRHDGRTNTANLMTAGGQEFPAAWWCADLQVGPLDDFHLPSQAELFLASLYAPQLFNPEGWYWSSTQHGRSSAFVQYVADGDSGWHLKGSEGRVRAVRWIQL